MGSMLGVGPYARTPNYWKTISVNNMGADPVFLTVTFGDNETGHHVITESHLLGQHETFTFPEQQYQEGGWTSVASVHQFDAQCYDGSMLGDRQTFLPQATAGVESAHLVSLSCADGIVGVHM